MAVQFFNLRAVACYVREVKVEGFGPSDAIGWEWDDDNASIETTADGRKVYSMSNDQGMRLVFNLMNTSLAYTRLAALMDEQFGFSSGIPPSFIAPMPLRLSDLAIGDFIVSEDCIFLNKPAPSKSKAAGVVQFRVSLPAPFVNFGLLNTRLLP